MITTVQTGRPLNIGLGGERIVQLAGEAHVPGVEVVLEPVVVGARVADVEDGLAVCRGVVLVPLQLQIMFTVGLRRLDAVRPCSTSERPE